MARAPVAAHVGGALSVVRMSVGGVHTHENLHHINVPSMPPEEEMPSRKHRRKPARQALRESPHAMETVVNGLCSHTRDELHHRNVPRMPPVGVPAVERTGGQPARSPHAMETVVNGLGAHTHDELHHRNVPKMPPVGVPAVERTGGQPARSPHAMETVVNGLGAHTHDQLHHIDVPSADR